MNVEMFVWRDPHSVLDDWTEISELSMEPTLVLTVGVVVKENEETVAISNGVEAKRDKTTMGTLILPKSAILQRLVIADDAQVTEWLKR